ncbi:unnamed protein product [Ectocarpus sp. 12 AP-2014]
MQRVRGERERRWTEGARGAASRKQCLLMTVLPMASVVGSRRAASRPPSRRICTPSPQYRLIQPTPARALETHPVCPVKQQQERGSSSSSSSSRGVRDAGVEETVVME